MGFMRKADFELYRDADKHYNQVLTTRDFLALGVGTIISTSIFTLPGQVAAQFAGPGVVFSYLLAALVAGFVALAYAEMSTVMPFAGSAYSWISVLFGEGFGWIAGWALLAEYFIAVAFVGSGFSATLASATRFPSPKSIGQSIWYRRWSCRYYFTFSHFTLGNYCLSWGI